MLVAVWLPRRVVTTLDPEAPSSSWHADPSFPVFVLSAFDHLAGGPDRLERVDAAPVTEILRDAAPPPVAAGAAVARLVRPEAADPGGRRPDAALSVVAGVLAALAVVAGSGRFSGPRRHRVAAP